MKGFNANIINFILFIKNQKEKHNSPLSHQFPFLERKEPYFSWFQKVNISGRKQGASRTKFCVTFSEFKAYIFFVEGLITFIGHFLKNKNRYLHYINKIYAKNFEVCIH